MTDYKKTLNLPQTSFPMRANLSQNEPKMLAFWEKINAYEAMIAPNAGARTYVLHDGPPYANGHIHLGTALNKVLKDIIVKSRNMQGLRAEYVPGWDCHGLPIELKVEQEFKLKQKPVSTLEIRARCREYATKYLDIQREEFKRLGVLGTWDDPYLTMKPAYEAATARELAKFMAKGAVVRNKKPVHWCCSCETALAEAEVEYGEHGSPSIYVAFPVNDPKLAEVFPGQGEAVTSIVIWTTTPWTIPDNMAVAVHPEFSYALVQVKMAEGDARFILAEELVPRLKEVFGWADVQVLASVPGQHLEGLLAAHPFYDRPSPVVLANYVTLEAGTGCVHTAPGHGRDDYETGLRYGLETLSPLDDRGCFYPQTELVGGLNVFKANPKVIEILEQNGRLLAQEKISHSYPHCWRCRKPVIFRATMQWFISMQADDLRGKALHEIDEKVRWIPAWGRERIHSMIANRPDWCISRQRNWGVPIVALICKECGHTYTEPDWVVSVVDRFAGHERGADYWFEASLDQVVPDGLACPDCASTSWEKEDDILDVWFDSGTSFAAVLEQRPECTFPADLYLEGSDQHRGWFHSSLLASVGTRGAAPYKAVLTHGYVVDANGRKMSKSVGNVIAPQEIIKQYGAEILRLWVASEDYQDDVRISTETLNRLVDAYRRIRNTCRFLLGNLSDFRPTEHAVDADRLLPLDRFALDLFTRRHAKIAEAYERYEFHKVFHTLHNMCVTDLSAFYLDIVKDRLYVSAPDGLARRSAQTVLWRALEMLLTDMAPVLSFTAEEVYQHLPEDVRGTSPSVFGLRFQGPDMSAASGAPVQSSGESSGESMAEEARQAWETVIRVRAETTKAIEPVRKSGVVGHSLDTEVTLYVHDDLLDVLRPMAPMLREVFIVSKVEVRPESEAVESQTADFFVSEEVDGLRIAVAPAPGAKCPRCWVYSEELVADGTEGGDGVCPRCQDALEGR
ncbi:isoleucine--tRNA ligase [Desulfonatronum thiodismutans]|uniref:isoleucine--tRNA ligase n=1 Tax=Desulfonatronum thiodismutans TaxID=159290 RepID=UPI0004ABE256|nr:isoleucine--tRNA ligase [Desulfonatronum thiodismutans]